MYISGYRLDNFKSKFTYSQFFQKKKEAEISALLARAEFEKCFVRFSEELTTI